MKTGPRDTPWQSAESALRLMHDAERRGKHVEVTQHGDVRIAGKSAVLDRIRLLFSREKSGELVTRRRQAVVEAVVNKMKIEVAQASSQVRQTLETQLKTLPTFLINGRVGNLVREWKNLQDNLALPKPRAEQIEAINASLPPPMSFSGEPGAVCRASWTMPDAQHKHLYASLAGARVHDSERHGPVSYQTWVDAGRAEFELVEGGLDIHYGLGASAEDLIDGMASLAGRHSGKTLLMLSLASNQEAVGMLMVPMVQQQLTRSGEQFREARSGTLEPTLPDPSEATGLRHAALALNRYRVERLADGDFDIEIIHRHKIHNIYQADGSEVPVNRSPRWQGDISDDNYGMSLSARFRISAQDARAGIWENIRIVQPLTLVYQIEPELTPTEL